MRTSVRDIILKWLIVWEGCPTDSAGCYMYVDTVGVTTVGLGFALLNESSAQSYPWQNMDGTAASIQSIQSNYDAIHKSGHPGFAASYYLGMTNIRLPFNYIQDKCIEKMISHYEPEVSKPFRDYGTWPAGAQLALLDMAWNMGPAFPAGYPRFSAAATAGDFAEAAKQCDSRGTPGMRLAARKRLFQQASGWRADGFDMDRILWP